MVNSENVFKDRLKLLIEYDDNLNSAGLAKKIDVTAPLITSYTKGNSVPSFENLIKIANYFNVSLDYLTGRSNASDGDPAANKKITEWMEAFQALDDECKEKIIQFLKLLL